MISKIKMILQKYDIVTKTFLGDGAISPKSTIRLNINHRENETNDKEFAIQFETTSQIIAIWNIKDRVSNHNSLDLYVKENKCWDEIVDLRVYEVGIGKRNSGHYSLVAVMPFADFDKFIELNKNFDFGIDVDTTEFDEDELLSIKIFGNELEGKSIYTYGRRYERNPALRRKAIELQGCKCHICQFDFSEKYGSIGEGFIEVHHIKPLCEGEQQPDPSKDLICICSNCHRMIHRKKTHTLTSEELKTMIQNKQISCID